DGGPPDPAGRRKLLRLPGRESDRVLVERDLGDPDERGPRHDAGPGGERDRPRRGRGGHHSGLRLVGPDPEAPGRGNEAGDPMSRLPILGLLFILVMATILVPLTTGSLAPAAPTAAPAVSAIVPSAAPSDAPTSHAAQKCPTPQLLPDWSGPSFFNDVLVSFNVPGYANLSAGDFQTVPCTNFLPTYLPGFWMNISTDVPLVQGIVNIWGTLWPTPNLPLADLPGY